MQVALDLDDDLLAALMRRHPAMSLSASIEQAVRSYLYEAAVADLRSRAGTMDIEDVSLEFRAIDRRN